MRRPTMPGAQAPRSWACCRSNFCDLCGCSRRTPTRGAGASDEGKAEQRSGVLPHASGVLTISELSRELAPQVAQNAVAAARPALERRGVADLDAAAAHVDDAVRLQDAADR